MRTLWSNERCCESLSGTPCPNGGVSSRGVARGEARMEATGKACCSSLVLMSPLDKDAIFTMTKKKKNKQHVCPVAGPKNPFKLSKISCGVSEDGVEPKQKKPTTVSAIPGSRTEDYNTTMKRMMRNPYEYHHDLGKNPVDPLSFLVCIRFFTR